MNKRQRKKQKQKQAIIFRKLMNEAIKNTMDRKTSEIQYFSIEGRIK